MVMCAMRKNNSESVDIVIRRFLREYGLESPLNQYRLLCQWENIVGANVAHLTKQIFVKNQTLYVEVSSPALRTDLMLKRKQLVCRLNQAVGAQVITDIIIH